MHVARMHMYEVNAKAASVMKGRRATFGTLLDLLGSQPNWGAK